MVLQVSNTNQSIIDTGCYPKIFLTSITVNKGEQILYLEVATCIQMPPSDAQFWRPWYK